MDGAGTPVSTKDLGIGTEEVRIAQLKVRLEGLLREAAAVEVELSRADGSIRGIPRYAVIEGRAHELGKCLSRQVQEQQMNELAADCPVTALCPECRTRCELESRKRPVTSVDGKLEHQELVGHCPCCRRDFFPDA